MQSGPTTIRLIWPPPGLEGSQGILWRKARELLVGGSVLVLPLLFSVASDQSFYSLGVFGSAWWVLGVASVLGLFMIMRALAGLFGFFRTARKALLHGIDLDTVLQVGADYQGDTGALLQGTRCYRSLDERSRTRAVRARVFASIFLLFAGNWVPLGWIFSLLLAARDMMGPAGMWLLTLGPAALALCAALAARSLEGTALQKVFGPMLWNRWRNQGQRDAARLWGEGIRYLRRERGEKITTSSGAPVAGLVSVLMMGLLVFLPSASLTVTSSVGSLVASMAVPRFSAIHQRAGEAEAFRSFRLPADPAISPKDAGEALHSLVSAGRTSGYPEMVRPPARRYGKPFLPRGRDNPVGIQPQLWAQDLFSALQKGLTPEAQEVLAEIADHPGLQEFETLASAEGIDVLEARLVFPLPPDASSFTIPIPPVSSVREAGYAAVAKAGLQLSEGDVDGAEQTLKTLISAGFLLADQSPSLIDALVGFTLVQTGGLGLESLYSVVGRSNEARALRWARESAEASANRVRQGALSPDVRNALRSMPSGVQNEGLVLGVRWEYLNVLAGVAPCINPRQVVFGKGDGMTEFLDSARETLVRYPSESALFSVMEKGWFNLPREEGPGAVLAGTIGFVLGDRAGSCAGVLAAGVL